MKFGDYFGDYLTQFVRTVDIVNNEIKNSILIEIEDYLSRELDIRFFTFLIKTTDANRSGSEEERTSLCTTDWYKGGETTNTSLKDSQGNYRGQVALAFAENIFLWIVGEQSEELGRATIYRDLMENSDSSRIPAYVRKTPHAIRTSIIYPVGFNDRSESVGVVNFESATYIRFNSLVWTELHKIAKAIASLYDRNQTYQRLRADTIRAVKALSEYRDVKFPEVAPKKKYIFIASSSRADQSVMGRILKVLDQYPVEIGLWSDFSETGVITQALCKAIQKSDYGICYLSEIAQIDSATGIQQFIDNPNVLFEAGMLSARSINFENWIPIREENSGRIPFDIAGNRILTVPRRQNNARSILNEFEFEQQLQYRLNSLLE
jgi:predicted nucleotide-binding protein